MIEALENISKAITIDRHGFYENLFSYEPQGDTEFLLTKVRKIFFKFSYNRPERLFWGIIYVFT